MTSIPLPSQLQLDRGYGTSSTPKQNLPLTTAALDSGSEHLVNPTAQQGRFNEEWDVQRGSSILDGGNNMQRSSSVMSQGDSIMPSRAGTLKKKSSIKRSGSRRSSRAGSVRSLALQPSGDIDEMQSAFFSPVPTTGNPTEILANRFQAWRKVLKDLITYFREIQTSYDHRSKSLLKVSNVINNTTAPSVFLPSGGVDDALQMLREYHKNSIMEANKSKDIEDDVILALIGLRSDLQLKIKEIKSLSGDFKNSVDKEMENTRKAVNALQDGLGHSDVDPSQMTGKQDPYLLKLAVDRQVEKQIDEESYLHQAYLNLEASGRELESIVVGEIQKSYKAYAGILTREADAAYTIVDELKMGVIDVPKDTEWNAFVQKDEHFVDPDLQVRKAEYIQYPGRDHELAQEVRAGLLERKSKYLKSYTAGWYVLSPTHLHEFKSADKTQAPIMSLYLPDQKLGSHSTEGGSSNKFMLKGRQTGTMHRGHSWVFRAESYETMLAWFEDIKALTEKSPQERNAFVRAHARSISGTSQRAASVSSDGMVDDEDEEPFSASESAIAIQGPNKDVKRPLPGGRFPSTDLIVNPSRGLQAPLSPSSGSSGFGDVQDRDVAVATASGSGVGQHYGEDSESSPTHAAMVDQYAQQDGINPYTSQPINNNHIHAEQDTAGIAAAGLGGAALGVGATEAYHNRENEKLENLAALESSQIAAPDAPSAQESEAQAAREAALIAAPDTLAEIPSDDKIMSGGRSLGGDQSSGVDIASKDGEENPAKAILEPLTHDTRPTLAAGQNHLSVMSISQLHVPGEFPKQAPA